MIVLGDESGYTVGEAQKTKLAAIEGDVGNRTRPRRFHPVRPAGRAGAANEWKCKIP